MISIKPEIEDIINDKFMRKIQPGTAIYDVNPPSMYGTINEPEKKVVETGNDNIIYKYLSNDTLNPANPVSPVLAPSPFASSNKNPAMDPCTVGV